MIRVFTTEAFRTGKSTKIYDFSTEVSDGTYETFETVSIFEF
jgi:hypothetical protein